MAWLRFQTNTHLETTWMPMCFDVLLPERFCREGRKLKTLYLLHGRGGNREEWLLNTTLSRKVEDYPLAVVLPECLNSFYVNLPGAIRFSDYLCQELPEYLEGILPLSDRREDRFIAGISMGGYGAFHQAFAHPEVFGVAVSFAGVMDVRKQYAAPIGGIVAEDIFGPEEALEESGNDLFAASEKLADSGAECPRLLQTCGTEDGLLEDNRRFAEHLRKLGLPALYQETPGAHDWDYGERCLDTLLGFLPVEKEVRA